MAEVEEPYTEGLCEHMQQLLAVVYLYEAQGVFLNTEDSLWIECHQHKLHKDLALIEREVP